MRKTILLIMFLFVLIFMEPGMTVKAEQNNTQNVMQTRINSLESLMNRTTPDSVVKIYSNPQFKRNGGILYAIVTDNLKQAVINETYSPYWSMGVSSPFCKSSKYIVKTIDAKNAEADSTEVWGTSVPTEDTQIQLKLHLIKVGDVWLIDSVKDSKGTNQLTPNAKPTNQIANDQNGLLTMLGYEIDKSTPEMTVTYYINAMKNGLDQCEYSVFTDRLATRLYRTFENENWTKSIGKIKVSYAKFTNKQMDENNVLGFLDIKWKTGSINHSGRYYLWMIKKADGWYIDNLLPEYQICPLITANQVHNVIDYSSYDKNVFQNFNDNTIIAIDNKLVNAKLLLKSKDGNKDLMIPLSIFGNVNINGQNVNIKINNVDCNFTLNSTNVDTTLFSGAFLSFPAQEINGEVYIPLNTVSMCFRNYTGNLYDISTNIVYLFSN